MNEDDQRAAYYLPNKHLLKSEFKYGNSASHNSSSQQYSIRIKILTYKCAVEMKVHVRVTEMIVTSHKLTTHKWGDHACIRACTKRNEKEWVKKQKKHTLDFNKNKDTTEGVKAKLKPLFPGLRFLSLPNHIILSFMQFFTISVERMLQQDLCANINVTPSVPGGTAMLL